MKKVIAVALLVMASCGYAVAEGAAYDLFPYENQHSSRTINVEVSHFKSFSVQVVYSTPTVADVRFSLSDVSTGNNTIYSAGHGLATAQPVLLATAPAAAPQPLTTGTTYFAVRVSDNLISLCTTYAQAVSRDLIDITTTGSGAWTLKPTPLALGSAGILWYGSNDGVNFAAIAAKDFTVTTSTIALTTMSAGHRMFDFGEFPYRYLRVLFNGPASGVIKLRALLFGREK
jgi:hypothetical protein